MRSVVHLALVLVVAFTFACSGDADPDGGGLSKDSGVTRDGGTPRDAGVVRDSGVVRDAGAAPDAGAEDAGFAPDAEPADAEPADAEPADAEPADAQPLDAQPTDAQPLDAQPADANVPDVGVRDAGASDAQPADAGAPDATVPDAGVVDGGSTIVCDVVVDPPETNVGQVGASGGSPGPNMQCPTGQEIIGVAVRMSDGNTTNGGRSAVGLTIVCAPLVFDLLGPIVGAETQVETMGSGQFGWTPATQSTITRCPAGWVMSGLSGSRGTTGDRLIELTLTCSELQASGGATGATQDIYIMGSLSEPGTFDMVACGAGEVVRHLGTRIGAGFDAATLFCAAPTCAP